MGFRRGFARLWPAGLPLLGLLFAGRALALDPGKAITQYGHDVWTSRHGLPGDYAAAVQQTRDGYLWVGTNHGLARFDGVRFVTFTPENTPALDNADVYSLQEDRRGDLWIGTNHGLTRLRNGTFTSFTAAAGVTDRTVTSVHLDRGGHLWVGTLEGVSRYDGGPDDPFRKRERLGDKRVYAIAEDRAGSVLVATVAGLVRFRDGVVTTLTKKDGLPDDRIRWVREDRAGNLWIATSAGLARYRDGTVTVLGTKDGLSTDRIRVLYEDRDGSLWIGTDSGLNRLRDGVFTAFTARAGLSGGRVFAIQEDREGSLWVGTDRGGLNRLRDDKLSAITIREGLSSDVVWSAAEGREGQLWIGTDQGVNRVARDGRVTTFTVRDGLSSDLVWCVLEDRHGTVWVGSDGGLDRIEDGKASRFPAAKLPITISLYEDRQGSLWIGSTEGLFRWSAGTLTSFTVKEGLPSNWILSIHEDAAGAVWIGTDGGLARLEKGKITAWTVKEGLPSRVVYSVHQDRSGALWIGTDRGAYLFRDGVFRPLETPAGPFLDDTVGFLEDDHGDLWIATGKRIVRVKRAELEAYQDRRAPRVSLESFGLADGMRTVGCTGGVQPSCWRLRDGRLLFTSEGGLLLVDPAHLSGNAVLPPVLVEEVRVDTVPLKDLRRGVVPAGAEKIDFQYTALSLTVPSRVRFRYRLDGYDRDWVDAGTDRVAHYTNLPPRDYTFRVIACNNDGLWNEEGARVAFTLQPFFYQTRWFYALCGLAVAAAGFGAHKGRLRGLEARQRELVRLVDDRTRDLQSANAELLDAQKKLLDAQERISRLLESSPGVSESVPAWSSAIAEEIARAIGAEAIGIWEVDEGRATVTPVSDAGLAPPERSELDSIARNATGAFVEAADGTVVPVTGASGELRGVLLVAGRDTAWGDTERRLLAGFAHQLGGALEMSRMRRQLAAAEEKRAATRREMHERGIATLQTCPECGRCYDHTVAACADDGAALESPRPLPFRLLDRYRFERILGKGGMGLVLAAHDEKLDREVAVKLIRPESWTNADLRQRFEREARAVAHIQHPGVVALFDSGELEDGTAFLVMEKLAGCDLGLLLETHGRGTPAQVASLVRQGCAALRAAHRAGIVHRDVKPANVFLVDDPSGFRVKLLDFGVAKSMGLEKDLTQSGMLLGTPVYMPPEQAQGGEVDARADVYSFAAVAYEALTGRQAIEGHDLGRILIHVLNTAPPRVSSLVPGIPPEVDEAFASALAKDPARRLKDIELWGSTFADALEKAPGDPATAGWPTSRRVLADLRDSRMEREPTRRFPGAARG